MLLPTVSISSTSLSEKVHEDLVRFAAHMSILGPVIVCLNESFLQQEENAM